MSTVITQQRTALTQDPQTVVRHVVAGRDVHLPQLTAVPGQAVEIFGEIFLCSEIFLPVVGVVC